MYWKQQLWRLRRVWEVSGGEPGDQQPHLQTRPCPGTVPVLCHYLHIAYYPWLTIETALISWLTSSSWKNKSGSIQIIMSEYFKNLMRWFLDFLLSKFLCRATLKSENKTFHIWTTKREYLYGPSTDILIHKSFAFWLREYNRKIMRSCPGTRRRCRKWWPGLKWVNLIQWRPCQYTQFYGARHRHTRPMGPVDLNLYPTLPTDWVGRSPYSI